jgi:hypothetical protein
MLEIRPTCENCKKKLPVNSEEAKICSFECTYCSHCANEVFKNVCPNCGGGFVQRPVRPKAMLDKYPASTKVVEKDLDTEKYQLLQDKMILINPSDR